MEKIRSRFNLLIDTFFEVLGDNLVFLLTAILMMLYYSLGLDK